MSRGPQASNSRIYIGNLPDDVDKRELEDLFIKFGRLRDIDIKYGRTSNGTAYAFVEFDSPRDAEDAIEARDGYPFGGTRLRVEFTGERRPQRSNYKGGGPPKRTSFRVVVEGLPTSASWQDLKDHMRSSGPVGYADSSGGRGVVEYENEEDMKHAVEHLDKSEFKNLFHRCIIRVREESGGGDRISSYGRRGRDSCGRSRSDDRGGYRKKRRYSSRSRSGSWSGGRGRGGSRSVSRSPASRSRSPMMRRGGDVGRGGDRLRGDFSPDGRYRHNNRRPGSHSRDSPRNKDRSPNSVSRRGDGNRRRSPSGGRSRSRSPMPSKEVRGGGHGMRSTSRGSSRSRRGSRECRDGDPKVDCVVDKKISKHRGVDNENDDDVRSGDEGKNVKRRRERGRDDERSEDKQKGRRYNDDEDDNNGDDIHRSNRRRSEDRNGSDHLRRSEGKDINTSSPSGTNTADEERGKKMNGCNNNQNDTKNEGKSTKHRNNNNDEDDDDDDAAIDSKNKRAGRSDRSRSRSRDGNGMSNDNNNNDNNDDGDNDSHDVKGVDGNSVNGNLKKDAKRVGSREAQKTF